MRAVPGRRAPRRETRIRSDPAAMVLETTRMQSPRAGAVDEATLGHQRRGVARSVVAAPADGPWPLKFLEVSLG